MKHLPYPKQGRAPCAITELVAAKSSPRIYRVGQFLITRAKCRWHVHAHHVTPDGDFSTLGGAIVWCHQQATTVGSALENKSHKNDCEVVVQPTGCR
jgi:hypothetical protein